MKNSENQSPCLLPNNVFYVVSHKFKLLENHEKFKSLEKVDSHMKHFISCLSLVDKKVTYFKVEKNKFYWKNMNRRHAVFSNFKKPSEIEFVQQST